MSDETNTQETEVTEKVAVFDPAEQSMTMTFADFFPLVYSGDWTKLEDVQEQIVVRDLLEAFAAGANLLREKFDGACWKGHSDGTVSIKVESIRKQREGDKPGKKAEELTPAQILAKRLKK